MDTETIKPAGTLREIWIAAVEDSASLQTVPAEALCPEVCLAAVQRSPIEIEFVPAGMLSPEICRECAGSVFSCASGTAQDEMEETAAAVMEILQERGASPEAVEAADAAFAEGFGGNVWRKIQADWGMPAPRRQEDAMQHAEDEALRTVRQRGLDLEHVPAGCRTEPVCLAAVQQNGRALKFVPEQARTAEICLEAVRSWGWALELVPEALKTPELCLEAVRADAGAVCFVPKELRTKELCREAITASPSAAVFVPKNIRASLTQEGLFAMRLAKLYQAAESADDAGLLASELAMLAINACPPEKRPAAAAGMAKALEAYAAEAEEESFGPRP